MFSTSTGSSPQSAPTTPDSSSNTGSDDFPSSQPEHNENHGPDLWGYSLSSGTATLNSSSTGIMLDDVGMGMMGLGFDDQTFESGQGTTPGGSSGLDHCSMPLQDLIHENLISNSPMASTTGIGVPQTMFPMAWFNRSANANPNGASQARSQSPSTPLNSPVQPMLGASSPPPPSIDTAFFTLSQPSYSEPSSQAQYPSEVSQGQALPSQQAHQQQQALPPDAFVHAPVLAPTAATNKRYPNGGGGGTGDHSRSGSTSNSQLQSPSSQSPVKVKIEKTGGGGIGIIGNAGLFSGNTASTSSWELRATGVPKKSRIETQVKLNLELNDVSATASSGAGSDARLTPEDGVPVKQYSYIRVPRTASVKTKTKGICDPNTSTVLTLTAKIYCASNPHHEVPCCVDCQKRERKRNIKKAITSSSAKASRSATNSKNATPATSDVEAYGAGSHWGQNPSSKDGSSPDGYVSPIDFTCSPLLDFASGNAALSFRIVCYCRHHKEKVGFCVRLTLQDNFGRVVGEVVTTPIMITDDHKSVPKLTPAHTADEEDGDSYGISTKRRAKRVLAKYSESEGRIKQEEVDEADDAGVGAIRNKHRLARKSNALSRSATGISRLTTTSAASTSAPLPITTTTNIYSREPPIPGHRSSHSYATHSESPLATTAPSSPSAGFSPPPPVSGTVGEMDGVVNSLASMPLFSPTAPSFQPQVDGMSGMMNATMPGLTNTLQPSPPPPSIPCPLITKVIPGSGPILGGIEVTLLGANFSREMLASAIIAFGENYVTFAGSDATTTIIEGGSVGTGAQVWSETVIICTLPPSAVPGPVEVKLLGVPTPPNQMDMGPVPGPIFVYTDENERDLMIMALQTLGWQNSGQWQDARSVAMHILGPQNQAMGGMMGMQDVAGSDISSILGGGFNYSNRSNMHARNPASGSSRNPAQGSKNVEDVVLRVLRSAQHPVTGAISQISTPHPVTGQTLLHLAAALGFSKLVVALIGWKANVQIPDKNGFSPVHFACFYGKTECVDLLVRVGRAHLEGRDCRGRMPLDICGTEEVRELVSELEEEVETRRRKSRIGSEIESGGEGDDEGLSWSEAEDDDEDEDRRPAAVSGAKAPQSVTKRISRANSAASIASHKAISRVATPFRPDDSLNTMTPIHPNPVPPLAPPSPTSSWGLGRNISMPWPAAGWQFPNVPAMPQFGQRRRHGQKEGLDEANAREESEQMFKWMMWMDSARKMWQAQQQQQPAAELDVDPPPMYSPTGATSLQAPPREKDTSSAVGTPAVPTTLEEPPSPLSLDSPYSTGTAVAGPSNVYTYHRSHHAQASLSEDPSNTFITTPTMPSSETKVVRRKTKTRDTMLIYFWIPVLILVIMGASYKSFMALSRFLVPNKVHPGMQDVHRAIEL